MRKCFSVRQATAEVYFSRSDGVQLGVSGPETRYWDDDMTKLLGVRGFPLELTLNQRGKKEVLEVPFHENAMSILSEEIKIFVTPSQYFNERFRRIFTRTRIQHSLSVV